ncbi:MAG: type II toxin-antitoxin system HicA family toxin [Candidatus Micrarchaeota archaeon]
MAKLRPLKLRKLIRALNALGFFQKSQCGSHAKFKHADGRWTVVPIHGDKEIDRYLLRKIIRECEVSTDEFMEKAD